MNSLTLIISDVTIKQDGSGRFCLNDFHKASGNQNKHRPSLWLKNQQTIELVEEVIRAGIPALEQNQPVNVVNGGNQQGVFVVKELVYAFAMWISPKFHLQVIRTFDAVATQQHASFADDDFLDEYLDAKKMHRAVRELSSLQTKYIALLEQQNSDLKTIPPLPFGTPRPWTSDDDHLLITEKAQGLGFTRIGYKLRRSPSSTRHRYNLLLKQGVIQQGAAGGV